MSETCFLGLCWGKDVPATSSIRIANDYSILREPFIAGLRQRAFELIDVSLSVSNVEWANVVSQVKHRLTVSDIRLNPAITNGPTGHATRGERIYLTVSPMDPLEVGRTPDSPERALEVNRLVSVIIHEAVHTSGEFNECMAERIARYIVESGGGKFIGGYQVCFNDKDPRGAPDWGPNGPKDFHHKRSIKIEDRWQSVW